MLERENGKPLRFFKMTEFLKGQASRIITSLAKENGTGVVLKSGKPLAVIISYEKFEKMVEDGIDVTNY